MSPPQETDPSLRGLDPLPGRIIAGNFRIEQLIGQGAMGNVYRAEQLSLGKAVAVKVLHPHLMDDDKLVGRFKREAKSASKLNHPNTIQIIDSGQDQDGTLYIAMELLAGRDLAQVLRDDFPLPLPRVVRIMSQVMAALDEAHAHGVIHRDLKPSNIMLIERRGEPDFVKVCDYGIAKATSSDDDDRQQMLTIQGLVCGTPEYMSPEQARAEPLDGRSDLYSAAIILYQLVTGDIPFRADSPMGIVSRHLAEIPRPPSQRRADLPIPKAMDELILRGMEKNRELRYPNALAFRAALEGIVAGSAGQLTPFGVQAATPTIPASHGLTPGPTALIPPVLAADKFGTTADLSSAASRARRHTTASVLAGLLLVGAAAAAYKVTQGRSPAASAGTVAAGMLPVAAPSPSPPPPAAPPTPEPAPAIEPTPPAEPAPAPVAVAPAKVETRAAATKAAMKAHAQRHHHDRAGVPTAIPAAPSEPPASMVAKTPAPVAEVPPSRGAREVLSEAEKLLGQGEVSEACARGEEAKRLGPKQAPVFKFLGKCYMRAGRAPQARENYQHYLDLAPTASDAPFIKSMLK